MPEQTARMLLRGTENGRILAAKTHTPRGETAIRPQEYNLFRQYLEEYSGIALGNDKQYLVEQRLEKLLLEMGAPSPGALVQRARDERDSGLRDKIIECMATHETMWFRDVYPFEQLSRHILPDLQTRPSRPLRIWSAACSSGQESYSLAMEIHEFLGAAAAARAAEYQIVATDISNAILFSAISAVYDGMALSRGLPDQRRDKYFVAKGGKWQVRPEITQMVTLKQLNLKDDFSRLGTFDVIFLRNVLIYFTDALKKDIYRRVAQALRPGGYLLVGAAESVNLVCDYFETRKVDGKNIYRKKVEGQG